MHVFVCVRGCVGVKGVEARDGVVAVAVASLFCCVGGRPANEPSDLVKACSVVTPHTFLHVNVICE